MNDQALKQALLNLPKDAKEAIVDQIFVPDFLQALGFELMERVPAYTMLNRKDKVDYALRYNTNDDIFLTTQSNPYLLLELKGKDINLSQGSARYQETVNQIKGYLLDSNCKSVQWGIITNSVHIQLFRKHGKVIYPATTCLDITSDNVVELVTAIKQKIENTPRALTVTIYNNKGGVGKTTTTVNLGAVLSLKGKKTLIIDFDPNQQDLTNSLAVKQGKQTLYSYLEDKKNRVNPGDVIQPFITKNAKTGQSFQFDIIPADKLLANLGEDDLRKTLKVSRLRQTLNSLKSEYDYILIDSPPNWRFFSVSALYAADVVLIPTKHNNIFSLENAAIAIKQFIPEVQQVRKDGGPIALPIFFNGENITDPARNTAYQAINDLIKQSQKEKFNLLPYFYPRYTKARKDTHIFELPSYAHIANAAFSRVPAAYKNQIARQYYLELAKEYFLQ
jgi:cellulose biosynthesis protein BcsQ